MRRAFSLMELATTVVIVCVLGALAAAWLAESRRAARIDEDLGNLQRFGTATGAFAADNADLLWGLSWKGGMTYQMLQLDGSYEPVTPPNDLEGGRLQMVHLIRLLGDRIGENGMPNTGNIIAHVNYSTLPLQEYLNEDPLARWTVSTADRVRLNWKDDPETKFDEGLWLPLQPEPTPLNRRWPYGSAFRVTPAAWDAGQSDFDAIGRRVQQSGTHYQFTIPGGAEFGDLAFGDVAYPSGKVHVHDSHQRHFGADVQYFGAQIDPDKDGDLSVARVPVLMYDASARVRSAADSNPGWRPNTPTFPCMTYSYNPVDWEPAAITGPTDFSHGQFYWTRGGLKGLDFGGLPLDTGQPEPGECSL